MKPIQQSVINARTALSTMPRRLSSMASTIGNYFTGQFFLEPPDIDFFRAQAKRYGFDEEAYIGAVEKVPIWSKDQLDSLNLKKIWVKYTIRKTLKVPPKLGMAGLCLHINYRYILKQLLQPLSKHG